MAADVLVLFALVWISGITAAMLGVAWAEFGQPRHALCWAMTFALIAAAGAAQLAWDAGWLAEEMAQVVVPGCAGFAAVLNTLGFQQRAGVPPRSALLVGAGVAHLAGAVALVVAGAAPGTWITLLAPFDAILLAIAARTLTGRRKGERAAERLVEAALLLLALINFLVFGGAVGVAAHLLVIDAARLSALAVLLLPGCAAAIGIYSIILLTGDLADQTRRLAATDMLTGLLNRRGFEDTARALVNSTRRTGRPIALVLIDVDRFKDVNDRFGHPAGDRVLRAVCQRLSQGIGRRDLFARIGGEEFALILTDVDLQAAQCAVEVLRLRLETMKVDLPQPVRITASFGVAAPEEPGEELAQIFLRADRALYRSKEDGRNRVTVAA